MRSARSPPGPGWRVARLAFVLNNTFTLLRRWQCREYVFSAHRSHLYQRLVIASWRHRAVTLLDLGLAVPGAVLAVLWTGCRCCALAAVVGRRARRGGGASAPALTDCRLLAR